MPRPRWGTTVSSSIRTVRCGTRFRSCAPITMSCRRSASAPPFASPAFVRRMCASMAHACIYGDRAMPLSWRHVKAEDGTISFLWEPINFRGPALLGDLRTHTYPTYSFFDLLYSEEQLLARSAAEDRSGDLPRQDRVRRRHRERVVRRVRDSVFERQDAGCPGSRGGCRRHPLEPVHPPSRGPASGLRPSPPLRSLSGSSSTLLPAWWATAATAVLLAGLVWIATRLFGDGYWLNLSQPVLASSVALFGGVAYQYFFEGRETRKMKKLFGRYVSKDVYEQLVANPSLARLGGHRREMTVLFSDIRGFTAVSEHAQPEEIVRMLNEYFTRMVDLVFARKRNARQVRRRHGDGAVRRAARRS